MIFGTTDVLRKQLAGPPSEFSSTAIPPVSPQFELQSAYLTLVPISSDQPQLLYVDSPSLFRLTLASPLLPSLLPFLRLLGPSGAPIALSAPVVQPFPLGDSTSPDLSPSVPTFTWQFPEPQRGAWQLSFTNLSSFSSSSSSQPAAQLAIIAYNENPDVVLGMALESNDLETNEACDFTVRLFRDFSETSLASSPSKPSAAIAAATIESADLDITLPSGLQRTDAFSADGLSADALPSAALWTASFTPTLAGLYAARAVVRGRTADGFVFVRSAELPFTVLADRTALTGAASLAPHSADSPRLRFRIGVSAASAETYRAYAQVYATPLSRRATDDLVPVAWIAALVQVETEQVETEQDDVEDGLFVTLELDLDWLVRAEASGPFELREVTLQSANYGVLVDSASSIGVTVSATSASLQGLSKRVALALEEHSAAFPNEIEFPISDRMRSGISPFFFTSSSSSSSSSTSSSSSNNQPLMLVHGYCSGDNPWEADRATFGANSFYFQDLNANRGVDKFANLIIAFAKQQGLFGRPWSAIGHSQGGMALAHVLNYYWTGLEQTPALGLRAVQSLGTPYQGCSMAGSSASLGSVFGVGCGANTDLTPKGAAQWLPGITQETRGRVHYYITSYVQGKIAGDYCNIGANGLLAFPNDGVTEQKYAMLNGAQFMGEVQGQCHVTGMKYPAQYRDTNRNRIMNQCARSVC